MMSTATIIALIKKFAPTADPTVIEAAVDAWLEDNPQATTTVQDGSITEVKLAEQLASKINGMDSDVGALKSAMCVLKGVA